MENQHRERKKPRLLTRFVARVLVLSILIAYHVLLIASTASTAQAAINPQINFQGRLLTPSAAPVADGTYNMEFRVYRDGNGIPGGGDETLLWTETRTGGNRVQVTNGHFSVLLGEVTAFGSSVDWDLGTLWLSVQIGGSGASPVWDGEMSPYKRLASVPQAFNADTVDGSHAGTSANNVLRLDGSGNVNIVGSLLSGGSLDVAGTLQAGSSNVTVTTAAGNLDADALGLISGDGAGGTSSGSGLETDTDRLGLLQGCADTQILKWVDGSNIWNCAADATGAGSITLQDAYAAGNTITSSNARNISITLADTATDSTLEVTQAGTALAFRVNDDGTFSDSTPFVVDSAGNVGIGTSSPGPGLDVFPDFSAVKVGNASATDVKFALVGSGADWDIRLQSGGTLNFDEAGVASWLSLESGGEVGVGVTTPQDKLDVNGIIRLATLGAAGSTAVCRNGSNQLATCNGAGANTLQGAYDGGNSITSTDMRNISITLADTSNDSTVEITQAGTTPAFRVNDDGTFTDTTPFIIDDTGRVGIGTDTPLQRFHVAGLVQDTTTVRFSGTASQLQLQDTDAAAGLQAIDLIMGSGTLFVRDLDDSFAFVRDVFRVRTNTSAAPGVVEVLNDNISNNTNPGLAVRSTFNPTGGGTQNAILIANVNTATSSANTTRGLDFSVTDATALANTNIGINIDPSTANSSDTSVGINVTHGSNAIATGVRIQGTSTGAMTDAILIQNTSSGVITDAIDASDAEIVNALNIGANDISTSAGNGLTVNCTASQYLDDPQVQAGIMVAGTCTAASGAVSLQSAYDNGNLINTSDARDIDFELADDTTDSNFDIDIFADNTVSISRNATASAEAPAQLLLLENDDADITLANALLVQAGGTVITDAIDVSAGNITNAINVGANDIIGTTPNINLTNFDVLSDGVFTFASTGALNSVINLTSTGDLVIQDNGTAVATIQDDSRILFQPSSGNDNANWFQILNSAGSTVTLSVDTSNTRVGIGTSSPATPLEIRSANVLGISAHLVDTTAAAIDVGAGVSLAGCITGSGAGCTSRTFGVVKGGKENSTGGDQSGYLLFQTRPSAGNPADAVRITSTQNVGVGIFSSIAARLDVTNTGTAPWTQAGLRVQSTFSPSSGGTQDSVQITTTNTPTSTPNTSRGLVLRAVDATALANSNVTLYIDPSTANTSDANIGIDIDNASSTAVATGIRIQGSSTGAVTTAIDASDAEIVTALNIGANDIAGTSGTITFTNFHVLSGGMVEGNQFQSLADGGDSSPAYGFDADPNTGYYRVGSETTAISGNSVEIVRFDGNTLSVGVGTQAAPAATLHVSSSASFPLFRVTDATATAVNVLNIADEGAATFQNRTNSTTAFRILDSAGTATVFNADTTNQRVGINTAAPSESLQLHQGIMLTTSGGTPEALGSLDIGLDVRAVYVSGKYAYVGLASDGGAGNDFRIYDISNPSAAPVLIGGMDITGGVNAIFVSGKYAYLGNDDVSSGDFKIVDVSNPTSPTTVGDFHLGASAQQARAVYVSGKYAFVGKSDAGITNGFIALDLSNPASPANVGGVSTADPYSIYVSGKYAYVGKAANGASCPGSAQACEFQIWDISNPTSFSFVTGLDPTVDVRSVYVSGKYAYITMDNIAGTTCPAQCEFQIIDIGNPASPSVTGSLDLGGGSGRSVQVAGRYAYLTKTNAGSTNDFMIIDVSTPASPSAVGGNDIAADTPTAFVAGKFAAVGNVTIAGTSCPTQCELRLLDLPGLDAPTASFGSTSSNYLTVTDNGRVENDLYVGNGLQVGMGGIQSTGSASFTSTDARDISVTLQDTATDANFVTNIIADNTVRISRVDNSSAEAPAQLLLLENLDANLTIANGMLFNVATGGVLTDAIDASDAEITNALNIGDNVLLGANTPAIDFANFDVTTGGLVLAADGGPTAVAFGFNDDADSGMYQPADNQLAFSTNNTQRVLIDASGAFQSTNASTANTLFNLSSTGDFIVQDAGTAALTISDTGAFTFDLDATDNPNFSVTNSGSGSVRFNLAGTGDFEIADAGAVWFTATDTGGLVIDLDATDNPQILITNNGSGEVNINLNGSGDFNIADAGVAFLTLSDTGAYAYTLDATDNPTYTITNNGSGNVITNLAGTGDFVVQDGGTAFASFLDTGAITFAPTSGQSLTANVAGAGTILLQDEGSTAFRIDSDGTIDMFNAISGIFDAEENLFLAGTYTGASAVDVLSVNLTNNTSSLTQRAAVFQNVGGSTGVTERLLVLDNADDGAVTTGLEIVGTSTGAITTALDVSDAEIGTALSVGENTIVFGATDASAAYDSAAGQTRVELTGTNADLFIEDRLGLGVQTLTLTDDGVANDTLTPTATYVRVDQDETGNAAPPDLAFSESSAQDGDLLIIVNNELDGSNDTFTITDSAGVVNVNGSPKTIGPEDGIMFIYMNDRWVSIGFSDN